MHDNIFTHNLQAYHNAIIELEKSRLACVVHATGTGKTTIYMLLAKHYSHLRILFLTSTVTLKKDIQRRFLMEKDYAGNVVFDIYKNLHNYKTPTEFDMLILDEFHHCGAKGISKNLKAFRLEAGDDLMIFGGTATEIRVKDNEDVSHSLFKDHVVSRIDFKDAILKKLLPMPHYTVCHYSLLATSHKSKGTSYGRPEKKDISNLIKAARGATELTIGMHDFFKENLRYPKGKYIVFCRDLRHLKSIKTQMQADWFKDEKVRYYEAHSSQTAKETELNISAFNMDKSGCLRLLLVVDILNEGRHLDSVSGIICFRKTKSYIVYLQQIGRVMDCGVDEACRPQVVDMVNNAANFQVKEYFDIEDNFLIPQGEGCMWYGLTKPVADNRCLTQVLQQIMNLTECNLPWALSYTAAEEFFHMHGHLHVPKGTIWHIGNKPVNLYRWVTRQIRNYHEGWPTRLSTRCIEMLEDIHIDWDWEPDWMDTYQLLAAFYKENGHIRITRRNCPAGFPLDKWLTRMRKRMRGEVLPALSRIQQILLDRLGMIWNPRAKEKPAHVSHFSKKIDELRAYVTSHGCFPTAGGLYRHMIYLNKKWNEDLLSDMEYYELEKIDFPFWKIKKRTPRKECMA